MNKYSEPVAYMHVLDSTEGIEGNEVVIAFSTSPDSEDVWGVPGKDYSKSFPTWFVPLYSAPQPERAAAELPTLPIPAIRPFVIGDCFTANQMHAYARAALAQQCDDAKDAARYRFLRVTGKYFEEVVRINFITGRYGVELDEAIDAAIAQQAAKKGE